MRKRNRVAPSLLSFVLIWVLFMCTGIVSAQEARFDILEYRVTGVSLLTPAQIEAAVWPHLGEQRTLQDVERAREALEKAYHGAGYLTVVVNIPPQKVSEGVVTLAVVEAPVGRLRVVESRYFSLGEIKAGVPELAEGNVPNFQRMQEELAALNRSSDRRVTPVLRPGRTPGTVEADLKVQDQLPLHGSVELNNQQSADTTATRASANLRFDNLWHSQHSLGLTLRTAPERPDDGSVFSLNYTVPLRSGDFFALYGVRSDSNVAAVGTLNVVGKGTILGARYIAALRGTDSFFQTATFGFDYKDFKQDVKVDANIGFSSPIEYLPWTLGWEGQWMGSRTSHKTGVSFNFHAPGLVGNEQQFADKRYRGRASYAYWRGTGSLLYTPESGWSYGARLGWQLSNQALISNEQYFIGGAETVRGYLESAAGGDSGVSASLELQTPNLWSGDKVAAMETRAMLFYDYGEVRVLDALTAISGYRLAGAGVGLRWRRGGYSAQIDAAQALDTLGRTQRGDHRIHFRLSYQW